MEQCLAKCEAAASASKEYFDKSRAIMEDYGKELRADSWWLASVTAECASLFLLLIQIIVNWMRGLLKQRQFI